MTKQKSEKTALPLEWYEGINRVQDSLFNTEQLTDRVKIICDGVVDIFDAFFCRIWIILPGDHCDTGCIHAHSADDRHKCRHKDLCLHLKASSGYYTSCNGSHARVPYDCYKIGRIASGRDSTFLTNDVAHDPRVHDREWTRRLNLASFSGYKLRDNTGSVIGVLALFSRHKISIELHAVLKHVANITSQVIQVGLQTEILEQQVQRRTKELTLLNSGLKKEIREHKLTEKALLTSENRFHSLVSDLPGIAVQGYDSERRVVFWNNASQTLYGFSPEEAMGRRLENLILSAPMKKAAIKAISNWHDKGFPIPSAEQVLLHKNGREVTVYSSHSMQVDANGRKTMYCVDIDLTEQIQARETIKILMQSTIGLTGQEYFERVVQVLCNWTGADKASIGILSTDEASINTIAMQLNGKMVKDFSYSLAGSPSGEVMQKGARIYRKNVYHLFPNDKELTLLKAQGYAGVQINDSAGNPSGSICLVTQAVLDLPSQWQEVMEIIAARTSAEIERLLAEKETRKVNDQMFKMQKLESIGVLAGGIAHDFNNILTGILGSIELAGLRIDLDDITLVSLLNNAKKATNRATKLTDQLLTFSKGGAPVKGVIALPELITESADFVLHGSLVSCRYAFPDDLWMTNVDSGQVGQVIQNIIINAKDAMPDGGIITIECANSEGGATGTPSEIKQGDYVRITIEDTGIGMPKDILDKIFDPYFSTSPKGSGLGLAICHSIIRKHGGSIVVDSRIDKGTTFTIYLPAAPTCTLPVAKKLDTSSTVKFSRIMFMDDDKMLRNLAQAQLKILGHEVILVNDGEQAIDTYKELQENGDAVDLVIMDLTIPGGMGGKEAAEKLLQIAPDAKIAVASGYSKDPVMANYHDYGFCAAIPKPFILEDLKKGIEAALG